MAFETEPFIPKNYKISLDANNPQLQTDPDHLIGNKYVYIIKGEIFNKPININPITAAENTFQNPFQVIGKYLTVAKTANKDDIIKLYDQEAGKTLASVLADPAASAQFLATLMKIEGFKVKAIFQESDHLWMVLGYPISGGKTDTALIPFLLKDNNGSFILTAGTGNPSKEFSNITTCIIMKSFNGITYEAMGSLR